MTRTVDRLEGLALVGHAELGRLRFPTPALLESLRPGEEGEGRPSLKGAEAGAGGRSVVLSDGERDLRLDLPILAPEVAGAGTGVHAAAPGVLHLHPPLAPEAVASARAEGPGLLILANARSLWNEGAPFVHALGALREGFGANPLLWAPRVALPHRVALLVYLGVDLLDSTEGRLAAAEGAYLDPTFGTVDSPAARAELRCGCDGCRTTGPGARALHAASAYRAAVAEARAAAASGRLRELVESRLTVEPAMAEMLRYADRELARLLDERTPVTASSSHPYVLAESHRRPQMARFRQRLLERYRPPPSKNVLLLVPCSKTKPYRTSPSHRRFRSAFEELPHAERVHVVSVSSPIGLVPRELEDVPPARHYDIPVTGEWEESEQQYVVAALGHLLETGQYRTVVVHLDPKEYAWLRPTLASVSNDAHVAWTLDDDRPTSAHGIDRLRSTLQGILAELPGVPRGPLAVVREELEEVAAVQFGRAAAARLFAGSVRLAGRPWFERLTDGSKDLATLREERGLFQLTVAGARRLAPEFPMAVEVDPAVTLEGDLFVPGVRSADPGIRVGDAVVLVRDGVLVGVGEAALPGPMMRELARGLAVKVRHREHGPTDTAMTEGVPRSREGPVV